jgi:hypothetical protein
MGVTKREIVSQRERERERETNGQVEGGKEADIQTNRQVLRKTEKQSDEKAGRVSRNQNFWNKNCLIDSLQILSKYFQQTAVKFHDSTASN